MPDVVEAARRIEGFGAHGITVHPRPDGRHITYGDVRDLRPEVKTEFNIEGFPSDAFVSLVLEVRPEQVTLVPDPPGVLTSNAGWDAVNRREELRGVLARFKTAGIRTSLFLAPEPEQIRAAADCGTDRIELYTEEYAARHAAEGMGAGSDYGRAAVLAHGLGLGVNAGHDLDLTNLRDFVQAVPHLAEVSIGHALISDALYMGMERTVEAYLACM
jgi:pyridoxine 5-phosphate synthase